MAGIGPRVADIQVGWTEQIASILNEATLSQPVDTPLAASGWQGLHTEHMGFLLAGMQSVQRAYPGLEW